MTVGRFVCGAFVLVVLVFGAAGWSSAQDNEFCSFEGPYAVEGASSRSFYDPETKAYIERKQAEGKTKREAIRCLKRHLARRFHHILKTAPAPPQHAQSIPTSAPTPMTCLT